MKNIETLLYVEIADGFEKVHKMEPGTPEYDTAVNSLAKLMDRAIEMERLGSEIEDKNEIRKEDSKDRLIRNIIAAAGIVVPTLVTIWGTVKSIKFEETGSITTIMGRGFIQKLLPKK